MADPGKGYHHGNLRAALLERAEHKLSREGAHTLSLRELARDVGVSHGAPREHFRNKQALLDALAETGFQRLGQIRTIHSWHRHVCDEELDRANPTPGEFECDIARRGTQHSIAGMIEDLADQVTKRVIVLSNENRLATSDVDSTGGGGRQLDTDVMGPPKRLYSNFIRGIRELPVRINAS